LKLVFCKTFDQEEGDEQPVSSVHPKK